ncbi:MAG TPA: Ku protein [Gammaproteobacteria bacterium]
MGSATIAFGLVSIPVKLYSAAESAAAIHFNQVDRRDGTRVKQQLVSSRTGEPVPKDEIVKGYEFAKGQYVLFTKEELKALEAAATHTIDIDEFLPADSVDRIYFDKAYYLGPDKGGARAYRLLSEALTVAKRIAIGRYAARGRMHLVVVRPIGAGLMLEQLHYADEIRPFSEVPLDDVEVRPAELELAKQLIEQGAGEGFDPTRYRDEVRDRMLELIQRKVEGEDISTAAVEQPEHKIIDLMEALKASLSAPAERRAAKPAAAKSASSAARGTAKKPARKKRASA